MQSQNISINNNISEWDLKLMMSDPLYKTNIVSAKMLNSNHASLTLSNEKMRSVYIYSNKESGKYSSGDSIKLDIEHYNRLESYFMPSFEFIANFEKDTLAPQIKSSIFDKNLHLVFEEPVKLLSEDITNKANLIIDGKIDLDLAHCPSNGIVNGDQKSYSIATASIIAKLCRDRYMRCLSLQFPHYDWKNNAGYGTRKHIEQIKKIGITNYHRKSFEPIKSLIHTY